MLLCFHRRYIPRGSVSCFVKKNSIAICKKIIHVYRCFDTELALNNSVYKQQHCIVKTIYRGADNNSLCPFEFCHAWLQKKTAVIFLQAVNWKPIRSEIIFPCDPTKHEPVKINLMKRLRSVSLVIKKCKWVVPEKIHTPPTDGILEILAGGGVEDSGNPGGRGGWP